LNDLSRILVVDDDPGMRRALLRALGPTYRVDAVPGPREALSLLGEGQFALALVDVRLEEGDGYALCREIRARAPQTDVILVTGSVSEPDEKLFRSLEEGAFYFLFKPFDRRVLHALVDRCLGLQRERRAKEEYAATLAADLERARLFQHSLLPPGPIAECGWRLEGRLVSCDPLGGDLYSAQPTPEGGIAFFVSDIEGHGVRAAMIAGMLRSALDAARRRSPDPERVGRELRSGLDFFAPAGTATLVYGHLGREGGLRFVSAGHPPMLWQRGETIERLPATGVLLHRVLRDHPLPACEVAVQPGDRILAYTDGAYEARNPADQELGFERLEAALTASRSLAVSAALDAVLDQVRRHSAGRPFGDDVTLLLIERTGG
jgi:sigma-B regulation protein RsbU (phosphoserine phosphatase)